MPSLTTFGIAVFVLALSVPVIADDESRPLLDISRQVGTMEGAPEPHYWWLTDNKIVYFEHVRHIPTPAELRVLGKVPPDYAPGHFRAFTLRVSDGKRAPMDSLNATFGNDVAARPMLMSYGGGPSTETKYMLPSCAVSPDRKWFTWKSPTAWFAVKLDGTSKRRWPSKAVDGYVAWFAGTRCALVVSDYRHGGWRFSHVTVHGLSPKDYRIVAMDQPETGIIAGVTSTGRLLSTGTVVDASDTTAIDEFDVSGKKAVVAHHAVKLPGRFHIWGAELSTHGDRLAWVLSEGIHYHIYISDTLGTKWTDLGYINRVIHQSGGETNVTWPTGVRWLPGDTAVSYVFDGKLYRTQVPVNAG